MRTAICTACGKRNCKTTTDGRRIKTETDGCKQTQSSVFMFIAIVLGRGTNLLFGEVSFMSNADGSILQLACSIDYSIFLLHAFTREKATGAPPEQAMFGYSQ